MSRSPKFVRFTTALCTPMVFVCMLAPGCPANTQSTDIWVDIVSANCANVGDSLSAAAIVNGGASTGPVAYEWSITQPCELINGQTESLTYFTASRAGSATLVVTVTDLTTGATATNAAEIQFADGNATPTTQPSASLVVDAGPDKSVTVGNTVLLLGSVSGGLSGYGSVPVMWRQAAGPVQTTAPDDSTYSLAITVVGTTPGTAIFELIAVDESGQTATDTVTVVVTAPG